MIRRLAFLLLAILALAPHAAAITTEASSTSGAEPVAEASERAPVVVRLEALRVGDRLRYEQWDVPDVAGAPAYAPSYIVEILGEGTARDRYGIARDVASYRVERYTDGAMDYSDDCHLLLRGEAVVRRDGERGAGSPGASGADYGSGGLVYGTESRVNTTLAASFPDACIPPLLARSPLGNRTIHEGDQLPLALVAGEGAAWTSDGVSMPARPTLLHGRPALELRFNVTDERRFPIMAEGQPAPHEVHRVFVVADGLPGIAEVATAWRWRSADGSSEGSGASGGFVLTGYLPGSGLIAPHPSGAERIPDRHPDATFAPMDDARFVTRDLPLPLSYAEALQAALDDPRAPLRAFLDERPDARLVTAAYGRRTTDGPDGGSLVQARQAYETDGGWFLTFADDEASQSVLVVRTHGARAPNGLTLSAPAKIVTVSDEGAGPGVRATLVAPDIVSAADFAQLLASQGVRTERLEYVAAALVPTEGGGATWTFDASDVPLRREGQPGEQSGTRIMGDLARGDVSRVYSTTRVARDSSLLGVFTGAAAPLPPAPEAMRVAPAGAYVAPGEGVRAATPPAIVVAAAATGIAALALLVKLVLLPLFTRLRRARLLDHPVRAKLHAHVRDNPGAHLGALEQVAGVGKGAARRHLDELVKHRYLVETRAGGYLRYFVAGALPAEVARREALLLAGSHRAVYELFAAQPTLSLRAAATQLGMSAASVHKARRKLQEAGLLPATAAVA